MAQSEITVVVEAKAGDPVAAAQIGYAQMAWRSDTISRAPFHQVVEAMTDGREVSALAYQDNPLERTSSLVSVSGILATDAQGSRVIFDGRGGGYVIDSNLFLDIVLGRDGVAQFRRKYDELIAVLPELEPLTADHILDLPDEDETADARETGDEIIRLTIFGTRRMPGGPIYGSLFFATSHTEGVLDGFLYSPPATGWESEHGSIYVKDVLDQHALVRVVNQKPDLPFATPMGVLGRGPGFYNMTPTQAYAATTTP
ncbi:hypothetical protein GCM10025867_48780 (plasmid) [Frondihabitans sucicola]|uniref:Uncharacterized protein n=1 Tax=Frondihabitans sucicola TaxID=1268041 RepID=A0ABN6Y919_9MICO|nr:hypothetical protein [Frondihabitans sucicola]BDZ52637.1 hypothetical protein GCM10025867_48780 [Frondihabitans sucicola]